MSRRSDKKNNPGRATNTTGTDTDESRYQMSLSDFIKRSGKSQYFRRLIVRAIEDALMLLLMGACIWTICRLAGEILGRLGVG